MTDFAEPRSYFSARPVCAEDLQTDRPGGCTQSAVTSLFDYQGLTGNAAMPLVRPMGVAIAPILRIESPTFGDHVTDTSDLIVTWTNALLSDLHIEMVEIDAQGNAVGAPFPPQDSNVNSGGPDNVYKTSISSLIDSAIGAHAGAQYRSRSRRRRTAHRNCPPRRSTSHSIR